MAEKKKAPGTKLIEKLQELVEDALDGLKELLNPPRPIRVPVPATGRRR